MHFDAVSYEPKISPFLDFNLCYYDNFRNSCIKTLGNINCVVL